MKTHKEYGSIWLRLYSYGWFDHLFIRTVSFENISMRNEVMSLGIITKVDMLSRVYKYKKGLFDGSYHCEYTEEQKDAAHKAFNDVLDMLQEYIA